MKTYFNKIQTFSRHKNSVMTEGVSHKSHQLPLVKDSLPDLTVICGIERTT